MKLYTKKKELDYIQRIAFLSESAFKFKSLGTRMTDVQFNKYSELCEQIYNLSQELKKIHDTNSPE